MNIRVNTGSQTAGSEEWNKTIDGLVESAFSRFEDRITRVEIHLNDENSASKAGGNDKRAQVEVRMAGRKPISVTDHADTHDQALQSALEKMVHLIDTTIGKLDSRSN